MLYELWRNYLNLVKVEFRNVCCGVKRKNKVVKNRLWKEHRGASLVFFFLLLQL
ncbi:hypothetical protein SAMN02910413_1043 [Pseudobutyrivibrio sp. C4]|nr:hypothetical protein SAMN02910413_1043 [Pseudobutyrivibrio sp. C4]